MPVSLRRHVDARLRDRRSPGLDWPAVERWLLGNVDGLRRAVHVASLIAAGGSNLTYRVDRRGRPHGRAAAATGRRGARDRARHGPRVADPRARCTTHRRSGPGTARAVRRRRRHRRALLRHGRSSTGLILRTTQTGRADRARGEYEAATDSLVDVQVAIHTLDVDAIGLGDLAREPHRIRRAPAAPVEDPGRAGTGPRPPAASTRCTTALADRPAPSRADRRSSTATTASTTPCSAPTTAVARGARLGARARSATPVADFVLEPPVLVRPRRPASRSSTSAPDPRPPASRAEPRSSSRYATRSGRDLVGARLVHRVRLLEDGLHRRGRVRRAA